MKKFILVSPKNRTVYNFRGELVKKIQSLGYEVIVTGPNDTDIEKINALGVRFIKVPVNKNGISVKEDLGYYKTLKKLMKEEKPDVMLGYTIKPIVYGCAAAKKAGVKNVNALITGMGYTFIAKSAKAKVLRRIVSFLYRRALKKTDHVIFQNRDDREDFLRFNIVKDEKCSTVSGSGVNTERFAKAPLPERTTFFMLSRILKSKGVGEYLEAARIVKERCPDVRIMLLGACDIMPDAIKKEELQKYIDDGVIEYFGECENIPDFYKECSIYVLPSYREGTPRTVLEAMATGRAIITTDVPGCRETVKEGYNGHLVKAKDAEALAEKMIKLAGKPELIKEFGENSYKYCHERFDVNIVNADMIKYMEL